MKRVKSCAAKNAESCGKNQSKNEENEKKYKWLRYMTNDHKHKEVFPVQEEQQRIVIKLQAINNENIGRGGQKITKTMV